MNRAISAFLFALLSSGVFAGTGATTNWVTNYVSATNEKTIQFFKDYVAEYVSNTVTSANSIVGSVTQVVTNGTTTIVGFGEEGTNDWVAITSEYPDKLALQVTNATATAIAEGVTNGMLFVANEYGVFWNTPANKSITATETNFVYGASQSSVVNGIDTFDGLFGVVGTKVTKSVATALLPPEVVWVEPKPSFLERFLSALGELLVPSARADQWQDVEWYSPETKGNPPAQYAWEVSDSKGNTAEMIFDTDANGNRYCSNIDDVVAGLKSSVNSVFKNMASITSGLTEVYDSIYRIDAQMEEMASNLNKVFAEAWAKMNEIDEKLNEPKDDGSTEPVVQEKTIVEKTTEKIVIGGGGVLPLKVDGRSIGVQGEGTANASYKVKNFDSAFGNTGLLPYNYMGNIQWFDLGGIFDTGNFTVDKNAGYSHLITTAQGEHGVHLKGFYDDTHCDASLSSMIGRKTSNDRAVHFVLSKYENSGSGNTIHWIPMGEKPVFDYTSGGFEDTDDGAKIKCASDGFLKVNTDGELEIDTHSASDNKAIVYKDGVLTWGDVGSTLTAGNAISITDVEGGGKQIASTDNGTYGSITFVSDIVWDAENHQLKMTKTTVSAKLYGSSSSSETVILTAGSHYEEHEEEQTE